MKKIVLVLVFIFTFNTNASTYNIKIEAMKFEPNIIKIKPGDTVIWTNKDFFPHTVTSTNNIFNSKAIPASKTWTYKALKAGTFSYRCSFHPTMKATLDVALLP